MNDAKSEEEDLWWVLNKVTWPPEIEHRRIFPAPINLLKLLLLLTGPTLLETCSGAVAASAVLHDVRVS